MNVSDSEDRDLKERLMSSSGFKEIEIDAREELIKYSTFEVFSDGFEPFRVRVYGRPDQVYFQGDIADYVHFVLSGRVREVTNSYENGKVSVMNLIQNNGWLGLKGIRDNPQHPTYFTNAEAIRRSEILKIPYKVFREVYNETDSLKEIVERGLLDQISHLEFAQSILYLNMSERIVQFLKRAIREYAVEDSKGNCELDWKHQEIGDLIGATRESVGREINNLSEEGLVRRLNGKEEGFGIWIDGKKIVKLDNL